MGQDGTWAGNTVEISILGTQWFRKEDLREYLTSGSLAPQTSMVIVSTPPKNVRPSPLLAADLSLILTLKCPVW